MTLCRGFGWAVTCLLTTSCVIGEGKRGLDSNNLSFYEALPSNGDVITCLLLYSYCIVIAREMKWHLNI